MLKVLLPFLLSLSFPALATPLMVGEYKCNSSKIGNVTVSLNKNSMPGISNGSKYEVQYSLNNGYFGHFQTKIVGFVQDPFGSDHTSSGVAYDRSTIQKGVPAGIPPGPTPPLSLFDLNHRYWSTGQQGSLLLSFSDNGSLQFIGPVSQKDEEWPGAGSILTPNSQPIQCTRVNAAAAAPAAPAATVDNGQAQDPNEADSLVIQ